MAQRLKEMLIAQEDIVDIAAGPDSYRELHKLIAAARGGEKAVNVQLSKHETYDGIITSQQGGVGAFVSVMRGCNNGCAYCIVPFTRGRERSRSAADVLLQVKRLAELGYKEVTLLGQNVNSYTDPSGGAADFAALLRMTAAAAPQMRVRFSTSHPKDMSRQLLYAMADYPNICPHIHLPVQSGSNRILALMNRRYSIEEYMTKIDDIRSIVPQAAVSTDIIAGFCTETDDDHKATMQVMQRAAYDFAYMFIYSQRPDTHAARTMKDDVPVHIKTARLNEIIALQSQLSLQSKRRWVGGIVEVLAEGRAKKSADDLQGRTPHNHVVVFPRRCRSAGEYVKVKVLSCTSATLIGEAVDE
jgi:tRNA-2-methylthio-N6-dimethylallyladenosine synthase